MAATARPHRRSARRAIVASRVVVVGHKSSSGVSRPGKRKIHRCAGRGRGHAASTDAHHGFWASTRLGLPGASVRLRADKSVLKIAAAIRLNIEADRVIILGGEDYL